MALVMLAGFVIFVVGLLVFGYGVDERNTALSIIGILIAGAGIVLLLLVITPTNNYSEWKEVIGKIDIMEIEDGQYLIETEDEYIYKTVTYSFSGETKSQYVKIRKDKYTLVECTKNNLSDEAYIVTFTREAENVFGDWAAFGDIKQTKYIFYIP